MAAAFGFGERRKEQAGQNGYDGNHHQHFDQCKGCS
jgi:hypothetical protein